MPLLTRSPPPQVLSTDVLGQGARGISASRLHKGQWGATLAVRITASLRLVLAFVPPGRYTTAAGYVSQPSNVAAFLLDDAPPTPRTTLLDRYLVTSSSMPVFLVDFQESMTVRDLGALLDVEAAEDWSGEYQVAEYSDGVLSLLVALDTADAVDLRYGGGRWQGVPATWGTCGHQRAAGAAVCCWCGACGLPADAAGATGLVVRTCSVGCTASPLGG